VGEVTLNNSGFLSLQDFIKVQISITKVGWKLRNEGEKAHVEKRRQLLKENKNAEYDKEV
jgi:hypothetical protein